MIAMVLPAASTALWTLAAYSLGIAVFFTLYALVIRGRS